MSYKDSYFARTFAWLCQTILYYDVIDITYDVITDSVISSSARRRRKCWSEVQHNESIEELFDRMTSSTNTPPVVDMDTDEVTGVVAECAEDEEHKRKENYCKHLLCVCRVLLLLMV